MQTSKIWYLRKWEKIKQMKCEIPIDDNLNCSGQKYQSHSMLGTLMKKLFQHWFCEDKISISMQQDNIIQLCPLANGMIKQR